MLSVEHLKISAKNGDIESIRKNLELIKNDEKLLHTLFNLAIRHSRVDIARFLIDGQIDINYRGKYGWTALIRAVESSSFDIVELLVARGALIGVEDKYGNTALNLASAEGRLDVVKLLVKNNVRINHVNKYGWTALMRAVDNRRADIAKYLIGCGADVRIKDKLNRTAADIARNKSYFELIGLVEF